MTIPDRVNARWIATLDNKQLCAAEAELHSTFLDQERLEKQRRGTHYVLLEGPEALVMAWHRWLLVNNETRSRGVFAYHRQSSSKRAAAR
jgi:hypothetical protein